MGQVTCITGIDTDIGKTIVTGLVARSLQQTGVSVITQKIAQTGCEGIAEDIITHRKLMGISLLPEDKNGLTCPYVFKKACSPHLAAELEETHIDTKKITAATETLASKFDHVLLEGAGGLLVPLTRKITFLDYLEEKGYPLLLVSSARLGSINHTLSALEIAANRGLLVQGIVYNSYNADDAVIRDDSYRVFLRALQSYGFSEKIQRLETFVDIDADVKNFPNLDLSYHARALR
jgi:dethiobiotin synthetase